MLELLPRVHRQRAARADLRGGAAHRAARAVAARRRSTASRSSRSSSATPASSRTARSWSRRCKRVRQAGGRHPGAPPVRADAEPARRDPAQGAALLLEVGLPAPASNRQRSTRAIEHAARIPSPHSALILFQIGGALNELPRRRTRRPATATPPTCSTSPRSWEKRGRRRHEHRLGARRAGRRCARSRPAACTSTS